MTFVSTLTALPWWLGLVSLLFALSQQSGTTVRGTDVVLTACGDWVGICRAPDPSSGAVP